MTTRSLALLAVRWLLFGVASGCGSATTQAGVYIDASRIPGELEQDYASFTVNCSKCHSLSRALTAPVTSPKHWDLYVARMMRTAGSAISPREAPKILRFLHWYTLRYEKAVEESKAEATSALEPAPRVSDAPPQAEGSAEVGTEKKVGGTP